MSLYFSEKEIADIVSLLKEREKTDIECIPQISGIWLHDPTWQTELRLLVLPRINLTVSRVCFQRRRQGTMGEVVKWMIRYCHNHEISQICNEGSPGQALKRLLGLRTFGSPAAQTLASHTSFAGM